MTQNNTNATTEIAKVPLCEGASKPKGEAVLMQQPETTAKPINRKSVTAKTWVKFPGTRFQLGLVGATRSSKSTVYVNGLDGRLLAHQTFESEVEAMEALAELNEQLDFLS